MICQNFFLNIISCFVQQDNAVPAKEFCQTISRCLKEMKNCNDGTLDKKTTKKQNKTKQNKNKAKNKSQKKNTHKYCLHVL
jgi:hypothetical protein